MATIKHALRVLWIKYGHLNAAVAVFSIAVLSIIWVETVHRVAFEHNEAISNTVQQNANLAAAYEEHTIRTLKGVDQAVLFVKDQYDEHGMKLNIGRMIANGTLDRGVFTHIGITNEHGDVILASIDFAPVNLVDRDYFKVHQSRDSNDVYVGRPQMGRITGMWSNVMARRINKPDGTFGGVVYAAVDLNYFKQYYQKAKLGDYGLVTLIGLDGIDRTRETGQEGSYGQDLRGNALFAEQAKSPVGNFRGVDAIDGVPRFHSYRTLQEFPLIVVVATSEAETLASFYQDEHDSYVRSALASMLVIVLSAGLMAALSRQRRAMEALGRREAQFRATFNQASVGISHTAPDGRYIITNAKLSELLGYTAAELSAMTIKDTIHPDDLAKSLDDRMQLVTGKLDTSVREARYIRKDRSVAWINRGLSLVRDASGNARYFIALLQDITERKQAEETIRESELRYRSLFDNMLEGLAYCRMLYDDDRAQDFIFVDVNEAFGQLTRLKDVVGKKVSEVIPGMRDSSPGLFEACGRVAASGKPEKLETFVAGLELWFSIAVHSTRRGYFVVVFDNITERKGAEQLLALEHTVARCLADADDAASALKTIMRAVCESQQWECGRYLRADDKAGVLRLFETWNAPDEAIDRFIAQSREVTYRSGVGLAGSVWQTGEPLWVFDIGRDPRVAQKTIAHEIGLHGAFFFPVISERKTIGVLAFNSREVREPDERLLAATRVIGSQVGQFLKRKQSEEVLRESERRFRSLIENSADAIVLLDLSGKVLYGSPATVRILGYAHGELAGRSVFDLVHADDLRALKGPLEELFGRRGTNIEMQARMHHKDGSWRELEGMFANLVDDPAIRGVIVNFHDITERKRRDEELRRFRAAMDATADAIYLIGQANMRFIDVNDAAGRMLGYTRNEMLALGPDILFTTPPEELERAFEVMIAAGTPATTIETLHRRKDGSLVPVEVSRRALRSGDTWIFVAVARDISERKQAETTLRESEEFYRRTLDSMLEGCQIIGFDWRYRYVNDTAARHGRLPKETLLGHTMTEIYPGIEATVMYAALRRCMDERTSHQMESEFVFPDGARGWFQLSVEPVPEGIFILSIDITERRRAQEDLRSYAKRLEALRDMDLAILEAHSPREIVSVGLDHLRRLVPFWGATVSLFDLAANEATVLEIERAPGFAHDSASRMSLEQYGLEDLAALKEGRACVVYDIAAMTSRPPAVTEVLREKGMRSYVRIPLRVEGALLGALNLGSDETGYFTEEYLDIARTIADQLAIGLQQAILREKIEQHSVELERRVAERTAELSAANTELENAKAAAESANRAKSAFLAMMSHEIRTPMNGVIGMVEVLAHNNLSEHQADAVKTIQDSAFSLLGIIDDILDFSKIEAGRLELERTPVCVADIVEGICNSLAPVAAGKSVDLVLFIAPAVPEQVWSDPTRLRQVLYNLVGNAIKFSAGRSEQQGRVSVRVEVADSAPLSLRFTIADNGVGMTPETLAGLFTPFTQAEVSTTRRFGGTGLGLVICKRLVDLMQGAIAVQSSLGEGSTFSVTLPFEVLSEPRVRIFPDLSGVDCIVVKNIAYDAADLRVYLEHAGALVQLAADPAAAAQAAIEMASPVVVVQDAGHQRLARTALLAPFAAARNVRHLLIARGRRRHARLAGPDVVTLDGEGLRRAALLRAVAVAAGRASPETFYPGTDERPAGAPVAPPTIAEARAQGRLILVAEDDAINQKVILQQLELLGYAAELAGNGTEALRLWRVGHYALLLTDLHMPEMDGYTLAETIRREEQAATRMPILALTANALRGESNRARIAGMDEYLTKPVQLVVLQSALAKWLPRASGETPPCPQPENHGGLTQDAVQFQVLKDLVGDDAETIHEFLSDFLASARGLAVDIRTACAAGDTARVGAIAHKLKSSSRSVGALALGDQCAELENAGRVGNKEGMAQGMPKFDAVLAAVEAQITNLLAK